MPSETSILLCDDSRALRMVMARQLTEKGYKIVGEVGNGVEALEQYQALNPDIVLLDLVMPEKNGKQALREIMEVDENACVVILSSLGSEQDVEECLRAGAKSYLQKPVDTDAMDKILKQFSK